MTERVTRNELDLDDDQLVAVLAPRADLLEETPGEADPERPEVHRFGCASGPFDAYQRTVTVSTTGDGRHQVVEEVHWDLAIPLWGRLFAPLVARRLRRTEPPAPLDADHPPASPWWAPPDRLDARAASVLARLCGLSMLAGYLGTTITQTMTFAGDEFGASAGAQADTLSWVRVGVVLSLVLMAAADRRGRKRLLTVCAVGGAVASAAGALSPGLWALGGTQTLARAFSTALALLIAVVAAEEMPAGGRAYAASVLSMTAALGAGVAVALVPLAGLAAPAWRVIYVVPVLGLGFFLKVADYLPESRRFVRPHGRVGWQGHRGRLLLLATAGFFALLFLAPASQLQNDFLRDEHGFQAWQLTLFTFATSTPAGIGIVVGGKLADVRGRRLVGAVGTVGGAVLLGLAYQVSGIALVAAWMSGTIIAAMTVPALAVYGPELFPTALRAKANGIITLAGVIGSAVGLRVAGRLADEWGTYGPAMARLAVGPLIVAVLVVTLYPETAHRELEDINPEDALDASGMAPPLL